MMLLPCRSNAEFRAGAGVGSRCCVSRRRAETPRLPYDENDAGKIVISPGKHNPACGRLEWQPPVSRGRPALPFPATALQVMAEAGNFRGISAVMPQLSVENVAQTSCPVAPTFGAGNDGKMIGKGISQLHVATMNISAIIANQSFYDSHFSIIAFAPASLTLSDCLRIVMPAIVLPWGKS